MDAVIFDWGGTLSIWADIDIDDMWRLAARHIDPAREDELTARLIAEASRELGVDVASAVLEEAATHHLDSWTPHIRHQPDAAGTLRRLREQGYRIGLLSNTHWPRHFHEHFLERDGLAGLIDARLYTSEMEWVKPDGRAFAAALDALGVQQAVFVGDRLYDDVWGAKQAGLKGVWVRNSTAPPFDVVPDATIDRLSELPGLMPGLAG
jgi:putative hydrolase of the HAD superfamily